MIQTELATSISFRRITVVVIIVAAVAAGIFIQKVAQAHRRRPQHLQARCPSLGWFRLKYGIQIVAAENFWGSLVSQLAGVHGNVTSIVTDPNTDPHEYQSNPADAIAIANAKLVITNGMDYDTWAVVDKCKQYPRSSSSSSAADSWAYGQPKSSTVNPHLWYSPWYVNDTVHAMYNALVKIDPADTSYFTSNYATLNSSLYTSYMHAEQQLRAQYRRNSSSFKVLRDY